MDKIKLDCLSQTFTKKGVPFSTLVGREYFGYEILKPIYLRPKNVIFKARSLNNQNLVALKFLTNYLLSRAPEFEVQLQLEVEVLQKIKHHRVVKLLDFSYDECFIAYEYVRGKSLVPIGKIEPFTAFRLIEFLCDPLQELHSLGFVHCDVKPDNLMLVNGRIRLMDFGSVCRIGHEDLGFVSKKHILGTLSYLAPEQVKKTGGYSPAVDVFGLCSTLFTILLGCRFESSEKIVPNLKKCLSKLPELCNTMVLELFMRGLAPNPTDRFQSALELRDALRKGRMSFAKE